MKMETVDFLRMNIQTELESQGFSKSLALNCANKAIEYYKSTAKFSGGAYGDCCNHAGMLAQQMSIGIKYKQVKAKRSIRKKRPQEAWDF
jgi:hypothetical protein